MGVIIPVGEAQATFILNVAGYAKDMTWTLGILGIDGGGPLTPGEMADIIYGAVTEDAGTSPNLYEPTLMYTGWRFSGVSVSLMTETGPLIGQNLTPVVGTATGSTVPVNCAILGTKNTALGGRKYRGRCYLPPCYPGETDIGPTGDIGSIVLGIHQTGMDYALDAMTTLGCTPVLHHSDGTPGTPITGITLESKIATQRRRMR
jgi:hypothetical protein